MRRGKYFHCEQCSAEFYRRPAYTKRGHNIRFCSGACYSAACKDGKVTRRGPRPNRRLGKNFNCQVCGVQFYRKPSYIARGITKTCGTLECVSESLKREGNPFWGRDHSPELREYLSKLKSARENGKPRHGALRGTIKHTAETRKKLSDALRKRWRENRDVMIAHLSRRQPKPREEQRYRKVFTPFQRKNWKSDRCLWCGSTEKLVLDHIVSVRDGGFNLKANSQTLCQPCNIWKSVYVDRPAHLARLALQGGS